MRLPPRTSSTHWSPKIAPSTFPSLFRGVVRLPRLAGAAVLTLPAGCPVPLQDVFLMLLPFMIFFFSFMISYSQTPLPKVFQM